MNVAVECNGSQYNFSDFDSNLQNLLDEGKLPYVSIGEFDSMVSEKGWCDSFGYGTADLVLYAVYSASTGQEIQFYTNVLDWTSVQRDSNDVLQGVKLYDKNTYQELVGWYVKLEVYLGLWYIYNPEDESQNFNGYMTRNSATPEPHPTVTLPTGGEFQATTYFKVPKLSAYIIQKENIPVIGNGIALGFTDNHTDYSITKSNSSSSSGIVGIGNLYGKNVGDSIPSGSGIQSRYATGITTDPTKSGMITDLSNDSFTGRVMIQLFNSTTDTAVATCNQILADVSALNQGYYVIYYYSADITDHSHDYSNANTLTNHQWYRIYKSGWIEQGGEVPYDGTASTSKKVMEISLPVVMSNTNYYVNAIFNGFNKLESYNCSLDDCTTNSITIMNNTYTSNNFYCFGCRWEVKGFANITN